MRSGPVLSVSQGLEDRTVPEKEKIGGKGILSTSLLCEVLMCVRISSLPPGLGLQQPPSPPQAPAWHAPSHHSGRLGSSCFALQEVPRVSPWPTTPHWPLQLGLSLEWEPPVICCQDWLGPAVPALPPAHCVYLRVGVCLCTHAYTLVHVLCSTHFMKV